MIPIRLTQEYGGTYSGEWATRDVYVNPERIVRFYPDTSHGSHSKSIVVFGDLDNGADVIRVLEPPDQIAKWLLWNVHEVAIEQAKGLQKVRVA